MACEQAREQYLAQLFAKNENLNNCPSAKLSTLDLKDDLGWHNYFLKNGHDCTIKEFRTQAIEENVDRDAQSRFVKNLASKKPVKKDYKGLNLAYMPHMTYETSH